MLPIAQSYYLYLTRLHQIEDPQNEFIFLVMDLFYIHLKNILKKLTWPMMLLHIIGSPQCDAALFIENNSGELMYVYL